MREEEILSAKQLMDSIFEGRKSDICIQGIKEYFRRNHEHYSLQEVFEINALIVGTYYLYIKKDSVLNN